MLHSKEEVDAYIAMNEVSFGDYGRLDPTKLRRCPLCFTSESLGASHIMSKCLIEMAVEKHKMNFVQPHETHPNKIHPIPKFLRRHELYCVIDPKKQKVSGVISCEQTRFSENEEKFKSNFVIPFYDGQLANDGSCVLKYDKWLFYTVVMHAHRYLFDIKWFEGYQDLLANLALTLRDYLLPEGNYSCASLAPASFADSIYVRLTLPQPKDTRFTEHSVTGLGVYTTFYQKDESTNPNNVVMGGVHFYLFGLHFLVSIDKIWIDKLDQIAVTANYTWLKITSGSGGVQIPPITARKFHWGAFVNSLSLAEDNKVLLVFQTLATFTESYENVAFRPFRIEDVKFKMPHSHVLQCLKEGLYYQLVSHTEDFGEWTFRMTDKKIQEQYKMMSQSDTIGLYLDRLSTNISHKAKFWYFGRREKRMIFVDVKFLHDCSNHFVTSFEVTRFDGNFVFTASVPLLERVVAFDFVTLRSVMEEQMLKYCTEGGEFLSMV